MKFAIESAKFVLVSQLFEDCPDAWDEFEQECDDITFGDLNRSLVTPERIMEKILEIQSNGAEELGTSLWNQLCEVQTRIGLIPTGLLVDLEN